MMRKPSNTMFEVMLSAAMMLKELSVLFADHADITIQYRWVVGDVALLTYVGFRAGESAVDVHSVPQEEGDGPNARCCGLVLTCGDPDIVSGDRDAQRRLKVGERVRPIHAATVPSGGRTDMVCGRGGY